MILVVISGDSFMIYHEPEKLGKTEEELMEMGVLLESEPVPEEILGKDAVLRFNGEILYYEYVDIVPTEIEMLRSDLNDAVMELSLLIAMGGNI